MRVALGQDGLHSVRVNECDESEHALLLVWDAHILHRPVHAEVVGHGLLAEGGVGPKCQVDLSRRGAVDEVAAVHPR
uniref:Uncharacterized protein n=1 Tax=Arundo donax TaxID=35708 RepID=A0A0A9BDS9_ARUDO